MKPKFMLSKTIILIAALAVFSVSAMAQSARDIKAIETEVAAIDKAPGSYKERTETVSGSRLDGAKATFFTSGKRLVKVLALYEAEGVRGHVETYYKNGKLIYINWKAYLQRSGGEKLEVERYYFVKGKLVKIIDGATEMKRGNDNFIEMEREVLLAAEDLRSEFEN
jgi:hypothetical protein